MPWKRLITSPSITPWTWTLRHARSLSLSQNARQTHPHDQHASSSRAHGTRHDSRAASDERTHDL
jgi:hypothetical protein